MSNNECWKLFKIFLEMNGALGSYNYYRRVGRFDGDYLYPTTKGLKGDPYNYLAESFTWDKTKQGGKYWAKLSDKWEGIVDKIEEEEGEIGEE